MHEDRLYVSIGWCFEDPNVRVAGGRLSLISVRHRPGSATDQITRGRWARQILAWAGSSEVGQSLRWRQTAGTAWYRRLWSRIINRRRPGKGGILMIPGPHRKVQQLQQAKIPALRIIREYRAEIYGGWSYWSCWLQGSALLPATPAAPAKINPSPIFPENT